MRTESQIPRKPGVCLGQKGRLGDPGSALYLITLLRTPVPLNLPTPEPFWSMQFLTPPDMTLLLGLSSLLFPHQKVCPKGIAICFVHICVPST